MLLFGFINVKNFKNLKSFSFFNIYFKGLFITSPGLWVNLELCSGAFYTTIYIKCQCVVFFSVVIFLKLDSQSCADEIVPARA